MKEEGKVRILGISEDEDRGILDRIRFRRESIDVEQLKADINEFLTSMQSLFLESKNMVKFGDFSLDQVTFSVEVSSKGKISLIGAGGEVAGKGGISFTLKRQESSGS